MQIIAPTQQATWLDLGWQLTYRPGFPLARATWHVRRDRHEGAVGRRATLVVARSAGEPANQLVTRHTGAAASDLLIVRAADRSTYQGRIQDRQQILLIGP